MKRVLCGALMLLVLDCEAQSALDVEVHLNQAGAGGSVRIALCPGEMAYEKEEGCIARTVPATGSKVLLHVTDLPPGTYAVKVFHDVNDNSKLDTNWMGIPNEPYGFSNDAAGTFGPPGFKEASFVVGPGRSSIRINVKG